MSSRRALKLAEAIRHVVSSAILFELKDPRVRDVTVTYVEVSGDLRFAKVHVSVMGDEKQQRLTLRGLENAAGFLQSRCAEKIETRWTPKLQFILDQGVKHSIEVARILAEVLPPSAESEQPDTDDEDLAELDDQDEAPAQLEAETSARLDDERSEHAEAESISGGEESADHSVAEAASDENRSQSDENDPSVRHCKNVE